MNATVLTGLHCRNRWWLGVENSQSIIIVIAFLSMFQSINSLVLRKFSSERLTSKSQGDYTVFPKCNYSISFYLFINF